MLGSSLRTFSAGVLLAGAAVASDYYVDPVNGHDAHSGTSPADAWKTVSHVRGTLGYSLDTVHLASGVYSASSGESFPFTLYGQYLVGDQGASSTILQGGSVIFAAFNGPGSTDSWASQIRGVTFRGASDAAITCTGFVDLADVTIENATQAGIRAQPTFPNGYMVIQLRRVDIHGCSRALDLSGANFGSDALTAEDCAFTGQTLDGLALGRYGTYTLRRCRIEGNAANGVRVGPTLTTITLEDCLVARNGADAIHIFDATGSIDAAHLGLSLSRSTLADNVGKGVTGDPNADSTFTLSLASSILYGNSVDYDVALNQYGSAGASWCDVGDGHFAGSNGNIAADPRFVDPANDDFRLRFGSPCIDVGDPATPNGTLDLAGNARPIDGDLDTNERADIGAFEHAPLFLVSTGHAGTPLQLELWGQSGGSTTVYFSRLAPVSPQSTPFGQFDLNPASVGTLLTSAAAPGPPIVFHRPIPNNPLLVGRTFSFQALTSSNAAPQGFAYTNAVSVTITP